MTHFQLGCPANRKRGCQPLPRLTPQCVEKIHNCDGKGSRMLNFKSSTANLKRCKMLLVALFECCASKVIPAGPLPGWFSAKQWAKQVSNRSAADYSRWFAVFNAIKGLGIYTTVACGSAANAAVYLPGTHASAHSNVSRHLECTAHSAASTPQCKAAQLLEGGKPGQCTRMHSLVVCGLFVGACGELKHIHGRNVGIKIWVGGAEKVRLLAQWKLK